MALKAVMIVTEYQPGSSHFYVSAGERGDPPPPTLLNGVSLLRKLALNSTHLVNETPPPQSNPSLLPHPGFLLFSLSPSD